VGGVIKVLWLIVVICLAILLGQSLALFNLPNVPDLRAMVPLVQALQRAVPTPSSDPAQVVVSKPSAAPSPAPTTQPAVCDPSAPRFVNGAAGLKAMIGAEMGDAIECERVVDAAGNTEQKTTTGLAYYRADANITVFTNGAEHWALTGNGLVRWTGEALEPPPDAEVQR
jgi:hypothetical protein